MKRLVQCGPVAVVLCCSLLLGGVGPAGAAVSGNDARQQRDDVRARRAVAAAELDVLQASDADVRVALDGLDQNLAEQRDELQAAETALVASSAAVSDAQAAEAAKVVEIESTRRSLQALTLSAYVGTPAASPIDVLSPDTEAATALRFGLTQFQSTRLDLAIDKMRSDSQDLAALRVAAQQAQVEASARRSDAADRFQKMVTAESDQQALANKLQDRIDRTLFEVQFLSTLDKQLSDQIAADEAALAARLAAAAKKAAADRVAREATSSAAAAAAKQTAKGSGASAGKGSTTSVKSSVSPAKGSSSSRVTATSSTVNSSGAPSVAGTDGGAGDATATAPPVSGDGGGSASGGTVPTIAPVDVTTVAGITVASSIADSVERLMKAARAASLPLAGAGFRNPADQIETRRKNCGPTTYDIYEKPGSLCNPQTARPGRSMHERGLAIDFTCGGLVVLKGDKCFAWLTKNAGSFGLKNLSSEPWHWSTNGN